MFTQADPSRRSVGAIDAPFVDPAVSQSGRPPTLRRRIKLGTFAALDQRISLRYAMAPMTAIETAGYITQHLKLAGRADTLFSDDATALIHQVSRGLPRAVNNQKWLDSARFEKYLEP